MRHSDRASEPYGPKESEYLRFRDSDWEFAVAKRRALMGTLKCIVSHCGSVAYRGNRPKKLSSSPDSRLDSSTSRTTRFVATYRSLPLPSHRTPARQDIASRVSEL